MTVAHSGDAPPLARRVALLRAVNVGGANALDMSALVQVAQALGWRRPSTYLRTGNLLFEAEGRSEDLSVQLREAIATGLGLDIAVVIRSKAELSALLAAHPFADGDPAKTVIACCDRPVSVEGAARLTALLAGNEQVAVAGADIFAAFPGGQGRSKLALGMARAVRPAEVTARNLLTIARLIELADQ